MASTYTDKAGVEAEMRGITFTDDTEVTSSQLDRIIMQESSMIDASLTKRYQVPIDKNNSPCAYAIIEAICIQAVLKRILPLMSRLSSKEKDSANTAFDPAMRLKDIRDGKIRLDDAIQVSTSSGFGLSYDFPEVNLKDGRDNW